MIVLKNVSYEWEDGQRVLNNINIEIKSGEFVLVSGRSGSGKSTIGRVINGLIPHYYQGRLRGSVYINGVATGDMQLHEIGRIVGTVFQDPRSQFFTTTTDEEIAFGLQTIVKDREEMVRRVDHIYRELDIEELKDTSVFELSSGQKQKIAIASICAMEPKVLVLDEPSANLDMKATDDLSRILQRLKEAGTTIVLIEHRLYYAAALFDRFILVSDGRIQRDCPRAELLKLDKAFFAEQGLRALELTDCRLLNDKVNGSWNERLIYGTGLSFYYRSCRREKKYILKALDFELNTGTAIGLIGLNGAGKTTFARLLSGIEQVQSGLIADTAHMVLNEKARLERSYFVFQDSDYQLFSESVLDEMMLGFSGDHRAAARALLKKMYLEKYADKHPFTLSRGEKQRLTIALGQMKRAKLFLYDEPTSGCDRDSMYAVSSLIKEQVADGVTALIISHDFEFLAATVSTIWFMKDGRIECSIAMNEVHRQFVMELMRGNAA